jgi:hypothetical protein
VTDLQGVLGVVQSTPISIKGEAYKIEMDIKFPQEGLAGVDFGVLRWELDISRHALRGPPCCSTPVISLTAAAKGCLAITTM